MASDIKWLFFDVGGTLFDEEPVYKFQEDLIFELLNQNGVEVTEAEFADVIRTARRYYLPRYVNHLIWVFTEDPELYEDVSLQFEQTINQLPYNQYRKIVQPFPGIKDMLMELSQNYQLGIICNQPPAIRQRLEEEGLDELLPIQAISSEMGLRKPDLRFFLSAMVMAQCSPEQTMMIGDRLDNDIYPGRMLGMTTIRLKTGPHRHQPVLSPEYLPHHTAHSIDNLREYLTGHLLVSQSTGAEIVW